MTATCPSGVACPFLWSSLPFRVQGPVSECTWEAPEISNPQLLGEGVFQEKGGGSGQSLRAWAQNILPCSLCEIGLRARLFKGRGHGLHLFMGRLSKNVWPPFTCVRCYSLLSWKLFSRTSIDRSRINGRR